MTANVMAGGPRAKRLSAGMVDHIAKPLRVADMFATLARWIEAREGADRHRHLPPSPAGPGAAGRMPTALPGIDQKAGLATAMGNADLYGRLLRQFCKRHQDFGPEFRQAAEAADQSTAERLAHTLKGAAATIGAGAVAEAASELEAACAAGKEPSRIEAALQRTVATLAPVLAGLHGLDCRRLSHYGGALAAGYGITEDAARAPASAVDGW